MAHSRSRLFYTPTVNHLTVKGLNFFLFSQQYKNLLVFAKKNYTTSFCQGTLKHVKMIPYKNFDRKLCKINRRLVLIFLVDLHINQTFNIRGNMKYLYRLKRVSTDFYSLPNLIIIKPINIHYE